MGFKVLVTGASGYVGSQLIPRLLKDGMQVSVTLRARSKLAGLKPYVDRVERIELQENTTAEYLAECISAVKPDVVVHLASLYISEHGLSDVESLIDANVKFGCQLLEAMDQAGCDRLLNIGTSWQHYNNKEYEPVNLYAATKQAFLDIARFYQSARGFSIIDLKLFDTYGPNDTRPKLVPYLIGNLGGGDKILMSPGEQKINIVYIDDVLECLQLAIARLLKGAPGSLEEFAVSAERTVSLKELVSIIEGITARELSIEWGGRPYRNREVMEPWSLWERLPGWKPKTSLEAGLRMLVED